MLKKEYQLDISNLFKTVGVEKTGTVTITKHIHDFDPAKPKDHWYHAALLGFKEYKNRFGKISSYASIGAGAAIDAIGASKILGATNIILTDIHPKIPPIAKRNVEKNVNGEVRVVSHQGDLCQPLITKKLKIDLVYANIPNIPSDQPRFEGKNSASFYQKRKNHNCPKIFNDYLLTLQCLFLQEAKQVIGHGGAVIDAIGGRLPYEILKELFTANGYEFSELVSVFKIQTEPNYMLKGYAEAEKKYGVEFDFYHYDQAQKHWLEIADKGLNGPQLKEELKNYKISAAKAYGDYKETGKNFGHVVHILCGKKYE